MTGSTSRHQWCVIVPIKPLHIAKSRLNVSSERRRALTLAFAADTVEAAVCAEAARAVIVVTADQCVAETVRALGADVAVEGHVGGLNRALRRGAAYAAVRYQACGLMALLADLPSLDATTIDRVLARAPSFGAAVIADAEGQGTTAYLAAPGARFAPAFGPQSFAVHRVGGAVDLTDEHCARIRRDVDTMSDLAAAVALGVGPRARLELQLPAVEGLAGRAVPNVAASVAAHSLVLPGGRGPAGRTA